MPNPVPLWKVSNQINKHPASPCMIVASSCHKEAKLVPICVRNVTLQVHSSLDSALPYFEPVFFQSLRYRVTTDAALCALREQQNHTSEQGSRRRREKIVLVLTWQNICLFHPISISDSSASSACAYVPLCRRIHRRPCLCTLYYSRIQPSYSCFSIDSMTTVATDVRWQSSKVHFTQLFRRISSDRS